MTYMMTCVSNIVSSVFCVTVFLGWCVVFVECSGSGRTIQQPVEGDGGVYDLWRVSCQE